LEGLAKEYDDTRVLHTRVTPGADSAGTVGAWGCAMSEQNKVWYLRRLDLFLSLKDEEVEEMARLLDDHEIPAGAELLRDRKHDRIYLIKQGAVRLYVGGRRHR